MHELEEVIFTEKVLLKLQDKQLRVGRVVRASGSGSVDSRLIPSRVKPITLILLFTASLLCRSERHFHILKQ